MSNEKLVSIVLPTYNGSKYIRSALESIVNQTYENWELIIVDDCSTDNTSNLIHQFIKENNVSSKVKVIRNSKNLKLPASLNVGFKEAQGEWFTWTSDDNLYLPHALKVMSSFLMHTNAIDLVYASYDQINEDGELIPNGRVMAKGPEYLWETSVVGACFMYRRKVHEQLGGYSEKLFLVEDYDFWLRAACQFRFIPLNTVLYHYRMHGASLTSSREMEIAKGADQVLLLHMNIYYKISRSFAAQAALRVLVKAVQRRNKALALKAISQGLLHAKWRLFSEAFAKIYNKSVSKKD